MVIEQNIARLIKLRGNPVRAAVIGVVFDNQIPIGRFIFPTCRASTPSTSRASATVMGCVPALSPAARLAFPALSPRAYTPQAQQPHHDKAQRRASP